MLIQAMSPPHTPRQVTWQRATSLDATVPCSVNETFSHPPLHGLHHVHFHFLPGLGWRELNGSLTSSTLLGSHLCKKSKVGKL